MSKNKSLRRIDKEYDKQLKYPDINDYVKDTSYSTVTSNYHDNLVDTQLVYKMQDESLTVRQIRVANTPLNAHFNAFVLYGYHPDLESVKEIRLTIDAFSTEDDDGNFVPTPFKVRLFNNVRGPDRWSLILQSLIPNLGVNKAINYGIFLSDSTVASIYNYVFNTNAIRGKVLRRYIHEDMYEDIADDNAKLVQFVKDNLYRLHVPMRVEIYYVEDDEYPAFTFLTNFNLRPILVALRKSFSINSLAVVKTEVGSNEYVKGNYFTWSAVLGNSVTILPKYKLGATGDFNTAKEISFVKPANSNTSVVYNKFVANEVHKAAHLSFDIRYPVVYITYNAKWADSSDIYIFTDTAVKNPVTFPIGQVRPLSIKSYYFGHTPTINYAQNKDDFKVYITFSLPNNVTSSDFQKRVEKFQLKLFNYAQNATGQDSNNYLLLAGSLDEGKEDIVCTYIDTANGWTARRHDDGVTKFRVMAVTRTHDRCRMASVVVSDSGESLNNTDYFSTELVKYSARVVANTDNTYTLIIKWPNTADSLVKYFWPFAHFKGIELKMTDFFQVPLYAGSAPKNVWDNYTLDKNPFRLFAVTPFNNASREWYPRGSSLSLRSGVRGFSFSNTDSSLASVVRFYTPQFYSINGVSTSTKINISYRLGLFCKGFYVQNHERVGMIDANFIRNAAFLVGTKKSGKIVYNPFNPKAHFIKNLSTSVVSKFTFDYTKATVTIEIDKPTLLSIIKRPGGIPTGKGVIVLIPAFKFNAAKTYFEFSHNNGRYQNEAMFVSINL